MLFSFFCISLLKLSSCSSLCSNVLYSIIFTFGIFLTIFLHFSKQCNLLKNSINHERYLLCWAFFLIVLVAAISLFLGRQGSAERERKSTYGRGHLQLLSFFPCQDSSSVKLKKNVNKRSETLWAMM